MAANDFQVTGNNPDALFSLKIHRGEGMALIAMDWKNGNPSNDFVGFAIEFKYPNGHRFYPLENRITFQGFEKDNDRFSSLRSPIQKFRWVHFPSRVDMEGAFTYRVTPVFMNKEEKLNYGEPQGASIVLHSQTYPDLNVSFTRGFIASQSFVDRYGKDGLKTLLPPKANKGVDFEPTHPKATEALEWMGFEARKSINDLLQAAIDDQQAQVFVAAFDLSLKEIVDKLEKLGNRLKIIIDDSKDHKKVGSGENQAAAKLMVSAGAVNVKRQHMGSLQHNKMIVVDSPNRKTVVFGSTNFSWRGFFVQANNALIVQGQPAVQIAREAFDNYWNSNNSPAVFGATNSATRWNDLQLPGISEAKVSFSPHIATSALLDEIARDITESESSVFYSLAFLSLLGETGSLIRALNLVTNSPEVFVYGISDNEAGSIKLQKPDKPDIPIPNELPTFIVSLAPKKLPQPFKAESSGGQGAQLHHKFVVLDFDKPTARVYLGSYNFSNAADVSNGENLLLIKDRKIAVSYMIEAVRLFDHYHFRVKQQEATTAKEKLFLAKPPQPDQEPWWKEAFTEGNIKSRDRKLFS